MRVLLFLQSYTSLSRTLKFCFGFVQFTNRDVTSLLALFKAIIVYVRFYDIKDTYLSNEINAVLK